MYFEEPWFVDLNFRLNSFQNRIATMTSASVQSDNVDDFEEGEILDDDDDIPLPAQDVYKKSIDSNLNIHAAYGRGNGTRHSDRLLTELPFRSKPTHHPRSTSRGRDSPDHNVKISKSRRSNQNRNRSSNARNEAPLERRSIRPSRPNTYRNDRPPSNMRDRTRAGTPYEEKLREFQQRTRRLRSNSETPERKLPRTKNCTNTTRTKNCSSPPRTRKGTSPPGTKKGTSPPRTKNSTSPLKIKKYPSPSRTNNNTSPTRTKSIAKQVKNTNSGTSLLKRLVGSGSVDSKLLEDNVISEQNKCITNSTEISKSPIKEIPVPDNIEVSVTKSPLVTNVPIIVQAQVIIEAENNDTKKELNEYINENTCDSSTYRMDLDTDLLELRMAALKTAVVKNHNKRTSKGYVPKKTVNQVDDPIIDSFMEIDSILVSDSIDVLPNPISLEDKIINNEFRNVNSDNSDMCIDSNNSDDDTPRQIISPAEISYAKEENISSFKRSNSNLDSGDSQGTKKLKLDDNSQENHLVQDSIISDLNEELELRDLALRSFFGRSRKSPKSSENDSDEVNSKTETLDLSPFNEIEAKPKGDEKEIISPRKRNDSDNWEELDEDILRAHLLKTLSASLPERTMPDDEDTEKSNSPGQHLYKPTCSLFQKKEPDPELDMQSQIWSELMVPKLVISLVSDSESECESSIDFAKSLDFFLQEAKEKSEKTTAKEGPKPKVKKKTLSPKQSLKKPILKKGVSSTPVAVRHLPIQQQEEYRRLKIKLEKLKLNKSKGSTDISPTISRTESPVPASKPQIQKVVIPAANKSSTNVPMKQKQITVTSKSKTKIINRVEHVLKKSNVPLVGGKTDKVNDTIRSKLLKPSNLGSKVINRLTPGINVKNNLLLINKPGTNVKSKIPANLLNISKSRTKLVNPIKSDLNKVTSKVTSPTPKDKGDLQSKITEKTKINENFLSKQDINPNSECFNKSELLPSSIEKPVAKSENKLVNSADGKFLFNFTVEAPKKETVIQEEKGKSMINKQNILSSVNKNDGVFPGVETKDNEGNSDKENEVIKSVFVGRAERDQEILERLSYIECKMSDEDLSEKLKDAESKYEETLNLVSKLELALEEAKKMLTERAQTVAVLKELSIKGLIDVATLCVKNPDNESTSVKAGEPASETDLNSENTECCWDPDGVLCPFQLAGCCKDPSCSFHHIRS